MEREYYRRYTPSRLHYKSNPADHPPIKPTPTTAKTSNFTEKLIVQGIISGIIFAVVLALSVVDHPQLSGIRQNLHQALSGHISAGQVADEVNRFLGDTPLIPAFLPFATDDTEDQNETLYVEDAPIYTPGAAAPSAPDLPAGGRIDEDLLRDLLGYSEVNDLQTTAPEPMTIPEL